MSTEHDHQEDTRSWHERLKERDPEYHADVFEFFTPEQWDALMDEREAQGFPRRCTDRDTIRAIARIAAEP